MNRRQKERGVTIRNPAYRKALERLDEALERNSRGSNAELTELLGRIMFGDLWDDGVSDPAHKPE